MTSEKSNLCIALLQYIAAALAKAADVQEITSTQTPPQEPMPPHGVGP